MNVIVSRYFYLFQLVDVYLLSGNPEHVVLGDNVTVSLTYITDDDYNIISWINDA